MVKTLPKDEQSSLFQQSVHYCLISSFSLRFCCFHHGEAGKGITFLLLRNAMLGVALVSKLRSPQPKIEAIFAVILFLSMT